MLPVVAAATMSVTAAATDITGAGSSFVYPVLSKWSANYAEASGHRVNYQSIGSGGGIAQIKAGTVDFGASDKPLSSADLQKFGLGQFPSVIGGIVPVYKLDGIAPGKLVLDGATLAAIFLGKVKTWNAPAIAALNPGLDLPARKITVVHRSDGSGTTFNFTNYLSKVSAEWQATVGEGTAVDWPLGIGGKGNEGIAAYVGRIQGAIGYVEYAYATRNGLGYAAMKNAAGHVVQPGGASFQAAAASADWSQARDFNLIMTNAPGNDAWPIAATTWIILPKQPASVERSRVAIAFFRYAMTQGQAEAEALHYVPLPAALVERIEAYWAGELKH
ncbi:MAG TPA: phosphate ABC transporter substrate-binding protein PstS [Rhodanobacteraceae bacterium]|nr:phosphate ABC transporter substrate-binding protein PstS [Rhodanobacteraceae bacterium]